MKRIQLHEFNELASAPRFIRDSITEILGRTWRFMRPLNPAGGVFAEFCRKSGCRRILDLAGGTGEAVSVLLDGLNRTRGMSSPVRVVVSDLFPKLEAMRRVAERYPGQIEVMEQPVDATDVPADIGCDACTIVGAFHHFPPEIAKRILADCVRKRRAIFVLDIPRRYVIPFILLFPVPGTLSMALNPFLADRDRLLKAFFTFLVPAIPLCGAWDMYITGLRTYSEDDFRVMTQDLGDGFVWRYQDLQLLPGVGLATFYGIPKP